MPAEIQLFCPNTPSKAVVSLSSFTESNLIQLTELGGLRQPSFEDGVLTINKESKQPRVYEVNGVETRDIAVLVQYYKHLQDQGDATLAVEPQLGQIYFRDLYYPINELEVALYNRTASAGSTTEIISGETVRCGFEAPCYLVFDGSIKNVLGSQGVTSYEDLTFFIVERVDLLPSEITTQLSGTIRVAYGAEFTVDFTKLTNPYIRRPIASPEIVYSVNQNPGVSGPLEGTYKQEWAIQAEITLDQLKTLQSLLSRWRSNEGNITLTDLTHEIAEPTPRTRTIASGLEDISGAITRYLGSFNVGQSGALQIEPKDGDSTHVVVSVTFRELEASA